MAKYNKEKRNRLLKEATDKNLSYTDSHFHLLAMKEKGTDLTLLLEELKNNNYTALDIAVNENDIEERSLLVKDYNNIYLSCGLGPWGTKDKKAHDKSLNIIETNINKYSVKAIGEIGLDYHWDYGESYLQEDLFIKQIELANKYKLPIIIHNREADDKMKEIIQNTSFSTNGIIHCFSSDTEFAKIALDKGFYISFSATITYKKNDELRKALEYVPLDRLLLETDAPYLPPQPFRGKFNSPLLIPLVYKEAADIKKVEISDICTNAKRNLLNLLDC